MLIVGKIGNCREWFEHFQALCILVKLVCSDREIIANSAKSYPQRGLFAFRDKGCQHSERFVVRFFVVKLLEPFFCQVDGEGVAPLGGNEVDSIEAGAGAAIRSTYVAWIWNRHANPTFRTSKFYDARIHSRRGHFRYPADYFAINTA